MHSMYSLDNQIAGINGQACIVRDRMPGCFFEVPPLTLCRWRSLRTRKFAMMCDAFRSVIPISTDIMIRFICTSLRDTPLLTCWTRLPRMRLFFDIVCFTTTRGCSNSCRWIDDDDDDEIKNSMSSLGDHTEAHAQSCTDLMVSKSSTPIERQVCLCFVAAAEPAHD